MVTQEQRRQSTRAAILNASEQLFGTVGFDDTSIDDIALNAGIAKGAVYHHFKSKRDVFEAVFETVSAKLASDVASDVRPDPDLIKVLVSSTEDFFRHCADPVVMRIFLKDGPSVLGLEKWRHLDAHHFSGLVKSSLALAIEAGAIQRQPLEPLSVVILAAIQAAAIDCASQPDFEQASKDYLQTFRNLLAGLAMSRPMPT